MSENRAHRFRAAPELRAFLEARRYPGKWADVRGIAADNDAIAKAGGFTLDGQHVALPPIATYEVRLDCTSSESEMEPHFDVTDVIVANVDTLTAALVVGDACTLSFANADKPGGRYRHGGLAQEEDLCRCLPQLWPSLNSSDRYPIEPGVALVTRELSAVRRVGTYERCASMGKCTIITAAMPCGAADRRPSGGWATSSWARDVTVRIRSVLHAAKSTRQPNLIIGAFGCGAFGNPAGPVAAIFRDQLTSPEFRGAFSRVVFAILDPLGTGNLMPFRKQLDSLGKVDRSGS
eukprot:CAMPEP_0119325918 /NCGR_PEP_ID=MMETSP1333-20130426/67001_1 /TAXON_ID=418940 /ORGANISM="Scyphosphaera apsteinii, Strain RCC1455" /LENGTH=291 /DNA_ID=CAMNT_0007334069 /DNA_START=208 /DNA_END=1083 /DNA_ORIENTATION=+